MVKRFFPFLIAIATIISVWVHPAQSQDVIESLNDCLPKVENTSFRVVDQVDVKSPDVWRYYLVMATNEARIQWGTVPELRKDGTCLNRYPEQHVDVGFSLLPQNIAERFKAIAMKESQAEWKRQEDKFQKLSEELGIPVDRMGWD